MLIFALVRDADVTLVLVDSDGGALAYLPEHHDFGLDTSEIQEWVPALALLLWSLPLCYMIQRKGGLKWYKNRYYWVISVAEVFLFFSQLVPQDYATQIRSFADIVLLIIFIIVENKIVGEYREVEDQRNMIQRVQDATGITKTLDGKYPPEEKRLNLRRMQSQAKWKDKDKILGISNPWKRKSTESSENQAIMQRLMQENRTLRRKLDALSGTDDWDDSDAMYGRLLDDAHWGEDGDVAVAEQDETRWGQGRGRSVSVGSGSDLNERRPVSWHDEERITSPTHVDLELVHAHESEETDPVIGEPLREASL